MIYSGSQSRYPLGKMAGDPPKSSFGPGQSLPEALYEGLREAAFRERRKINEIAVEGIVLQYISLVAMLVLVAHIAIQI